MSLRTKTPDMETWWDVFFSREKVSILRVDSVQLVGTRYCKTGLWLPPTSYPVGLSDGTGAEVTERAGDAHTMGTIVKVAGVWD